MQRQGVTNPDDSRAKVRQAVRDLGSPDSLVREAAKLTLREMGPDAVVPLLEMLSAAAKLPVPPVEPTLPWQAWTWMPAGLAAMRCYGPGYYRDFMILLLICMCVLMAAVYLTLRRRARSVDKPSSLAATMRALDSIDDMRAIGPAVDLISWRYPSAYRLLKRLLPRLTADNAQLLTRDQRSKLIRMLVISNAMLQADWLIVVMATMVEIGEPSAEPAMADLAYATVTTPGGRKVMEAARSC
ncbi:MAG TPA: hypothetical protein VGS41_08995, partial [Chthonomonadales bacterium]|nr:hypothetical protein [Chthonomonadales bacterium]